ncbi:sulfite exporter TauE/SafE family protein [Fusobacterium sp. HC1336]|uniref:sulfite exporter TauE/SafE family protein n=1 Tax=Fusobacterium sp. HC1336 TaxID=3171169 RepID=UPI003F29A666
MSYLEILGMIGLGLGCGLSKLGIPAALVFSPILASVYGGKASAGIIIIPVIVSDLIVMYIYRKNVDKKVLIKILPLTILGIIAAVIFGNNISDELFKRSMGIIIFIIGVLTLLKNFKIDFSKLSFLFGFLGGIAAFIGNVSGPMMSIYLLNIEMDRDKFLGTRTWFYFIINLIKVTLYVLVLKNIQIETFKLTSIAVPFVFVGVFLGKYFIEKMNQNMFEKFILIISMISGLKLIFF